MKEPIHLTQTNHWSQYFIRCSPDIRPSDILLAYLDISRIVVKNTSSHSTIFWGDSTGETSFKQAKDILTNIPGRDLAFCWKLDVLKHEAMTTDFRRWSVNCLDFLCSERISLALTAQCLFTSSMSRPNPIWDFGDFFPAYSINQSPTLCWSSTFHLSSCRIPGRKKFPICTCFCLARSTRHYVVRISESFFGFLVLEEFLIFLP